MLGAGEAYLPPFAILLGAGSFVVGLLASLPLLIGSVTQLVSVRLLDRHPRRKTLVTVPAVLQAGSWLLILALPALLPEHAAVLFVVAAIPYFALGSFGNPPWNSWMGELVPPARRGDYFGRRDRLRTACQLIALVAAGGVLSLAGAFDREILGFVLIFGAAALARLFSALELWRMIEPPFEAPTPGEAVSLATFLWRSFRENFGRFTLCVASLQAATQLAGPFFSLYMLRDLGFSYVQFTTASAVCILAQSLTFHNWGRISDQFGSLAVLKITGSSLPFVPLLWIISPRFEAVLVYQVVSGVIWAGFNLSAANFIFEAVPPAHRARSVAYYNVLVNSGIFLGALAGGWIAPFLPGTLSVAGWSLPLVSNLQSLFLLSGVARLLVGVIFVPLIRDARERERPPSAWRIFVRVVGVQPIRGLRFSIFNGVHASEAPPEEAKHKDEARSPSGGGAKRAGGKVE
jgi:MFS family permease